MKRIGIVLGIVLMMSAPAWAQSVSNAEVEAAKADVAKLQALKRRDQELQMNLQNLLAQAQAAPAVPAAPPRPATAARGANAGVGTGVGNGIGVGTSSSSSFGTVFASNGNKLTIFTNNSRSDNPIASLQVGSGTWWNNPDTATLLGLTKDQQKKMDEIFQNHRIKLIDLNASLSKEEAILEPLIAADRLDEAKILIQVDKIAQARAELEKDNSRLLLSIRQTLTMDQWAKVQTPANSRVLQRR